MIQPTNLRVFHLHASPTAAPIRDLLSNGLKPPTDLSTLRFWLGIASTFVRRLHFHELRHTFATLALESRALDMHELSRAMGHASYAITDKVYAHVRPRDFSAYRAAFSAHISAGTATIAPLRPIAAALT